MFPQEFPSGCLADFDNPNTHFHKNVKSIMAKLGAAGVSVKQTQDMLKIHHRSHFNECFLHYIVSQLNFFTKS